MFIDSQGRLHHNGYIYIKNKRVKSVVYWRCNERDTCSGTAKTIETSSVMELKPHTHLPVKEKEAVARLLVKLEERVKNTVDPIPGLFNECMIEAR